MFNFFMLNYVSKILLTYFVKKIAGSQSGSVKVVVCHFSVFAQRGISGRIIWLLSTNTRLIAINRPLSACPLGAPIGSIF